MRGGVDEQLLAGFGFQSLPLPFDLVLIPLDARLVDALAER